MRPVKLTFRALAMPAAPGSGIDFPPEGVFLVPADIAGLPIADALRATLSGGDSLAGGVAPPGGAEFALDFEVSGERFRAWRCWPAEADRRRGGGALALLGRPTGPEPTAMAVIAEGPERVAAELQRLTGAGPGSGSAAAGVVVAPWARLDELLVAGPEASSGVATGVFPLLAREVEPVSRALGGRIRELLLSAHDLLRQATERLAREEVAALAGEKGDTHASDPADTLTPDELAQRRETMAAALELGAASSARLVDAAVDARKIVAETRRRRDLVDGYTRAEDILRKLGASKNLIAGSRRRLERARRAAKLADALGLGRREPAGPRVDPRVRERAEEALARAREEAGSAHRALAAEEGRSREVDAIREWVSRLEALRPARERLDAARLALAQADEAHARADTRAARARREADALAQAAARLEAERVVLAEGPSHLEALRLELRAAERLRDDVHRLAEVRERLRVEARELQQRKLLVDEADEAVALAQRELEYRARSGQPVAQPEPGPTLRELVEARDLLAEDAAAQAEVLAAVREDLRQLTTSLGASAYREPALLAAAAREKAESLAKWGQTGRSLAEIQVELAEAARRGVELAREAQDRASEADALVMIRQEARATLREREAALPETLREPGQLEAALQLAGADLATREAALAAARDAARRADGILSACEAGLRAAREAEAQTGASPQKGNELVRLRDSGFDSWDDFDEARLSAEEIAALESEISEHDDATRAAEERQRVGQDQAALPRPDLPQVELLAALLEHARDEAQAHEGQLTQGIALIDGWLDGLDDVSVELAAIEDSAGLGRRGDARPGGSFEQRVHESLMRALLARAEGRLSRWQHPWTLSWREAEDDAARHLEVRDAETEAAVPLTAGGATLLALSLALEMAAIVQEKRRPRLETLLLDAVPASLDEKNVARVLAALAEQPRERPIAIAADGRARELLATALAARG